MSEKAKLVLRGSDGCTEHAQGMVQADKYSDIRLASHEGRVYVFSTFKVEKGILVMLFDETNFPVPVDWL